MNLTPVIYYKNNPVAYINQTDKPRSTLFYNLPLEIIEKICSYLDLQSILSILNIDNTDIILRNQIINSPTLGVLKKANKKITTHKIYKYLTSNPSFNDASRKIFLENINFLSEDPIKQDQAIISVMASADYGMQFALANIMATSSYAFKDIYEVNFDFFKIDNEPIKCSTFLATSHPNKYLTIINEYIYLFDISTNEKEVVIDTNFLLQNNIIDIDYKVIVKNDFIVIKLNSEQTIILKKDQTSYKNVTPKKLSGNYDFNNKISAIYTDSANNTCFIILKNNKSYIYKATQHLLENYSAMNAYDIKDITPNNLKVLEVKTSENNNLTLFYGQNEITEKLELHLQLNGNIIGKLNIEIALCPIQSDSYQFFCDPTGKSFITTEIHAVASNGVCFSNIILNKISLDNQLTRDPLYKNFNYDYNGKKYRVNYINDKVLSFIDIKSKHATLVTLLQRCIHTTSYDNMYRTSVINLLSSFNQTKNLYATINQDATINIYTISANKFFCRNNMICDQAEENDSSSYITTEKESISLNNTFSLVNKILCKQIAKDVKFSPNSQLIITKEACTIKNQNDNIFNTIRMYSIIRKNQTEEFYFSTDEQFIAEINLHENIRNFDFHPSGLKVIVETDSSIKIIDLINTNIFLALNDEGF